MVPGAIDCVSIWHVDGALGLVKCDGASIVAEGCYSQEGVLKVGEDVCCLGRLREIGNGYLRSMGGVHVLDARDVPPILNHVPLLRVYVG